jgi:hypothetical protein
MGDFTALVLHEKDGKVESRIERVDEAALPPGEVTVAVEYSTLNYKDGMILNGLGRLVRKYPHVPGVDFAGTVERSDSPELLDTGHEILLGRGIAGELVRDHHPPVCAPAASAACATAAWRLSHHDAAESDPYVRSGRAAQEVLVELATNSLASMYPASDWSSSCSRPSWILARVRPH